MKSGYHLSRTLSSEITACCELYHLKCHQFSMTSGYHLSRTLSSQIIVYDDIQTIELMICRWCSPWHLNIACHELYNLKSLYIAIFRRLRHFEMSPILHHMWITNFTPPKYRKPHHLHIINSIVWISLYAMISDDGVRDRWYSDVTNYIICISSTQSSEYHYIQWL